MSSGIVELKEVVSRRDNLIKENSEIVAATHAACVQGDPHEIIKLGLKLAVNGKSIELLNQLISVRRFGEWVEDEQL